MAMAKTRKRYTGVIDGELRKDTGVVRVVGTRETFLFIGYENKQIFKELNVGDIVEFYLVPNKKEGKKDIARGLKFTTVETEEMTDEEMFNNMLEVM